MTHLTFEFENKTYRAIAQNVKGRLWVHVNGRTFMVEDDKKNFGKSAAKVTSGDLHSPMPGKITKIQKGIGQAVQAGDVVVVMEAMKMEYTLRADIAGTIEKVNCSIGEQVTLGKLLVKIKEKS